MWRQQDRQWVFHRIVWGVIDGKEARGGEEAARPGWALHRVG